MPNWVGCNVTIAGEPEDVRRAKEQLAQPVYTNYKNHATGERVESYVETDFAFWNITRPEEDAYEAYFSDATFPTPAGNWYEWNNTYWGTKWDVTDAEMTVHGDDHIQYVFQTAWSPPVPALLALSAQHPNLTIQLEWEEEQGFGGTLEFRDDAYVILDEYDIPSSHEEMIARKDYCWCEDYDPEEAPFADCPGAVKPPEDGQEIPADELEIEVLT